MFIVERLTCQADERSYNRSTVAKKTNRLKIDIVRVDDLPTEIFYEAFKYMQLHEIVILLGFDLIILFDLFSSRL